MSAFIEFFRKRGWLHPFKDADVEDAMNENIQHDASKLAQFAERVTESADQMVAASAKLRSNLAQANVRSFADFEHLIHHGERRRARH